MSEGQIKQYVDYASGSDTGQNNAASIEPYADGEDLTQGVLDRPVEHLRSRSEILRGIEEDTLYLRDADRALVLGGPGLVTWAGPTTDGGATLGDFTLSDTLYIMPMATPGYPQTPPIPPVASQYGWLILTETGASAGVLVTSRRRNYEGGDKLSVEVVLGGIAGAVSVALSDLSPAGERTIVVTANAPTLTDTINALNALTADSPAVQLVTATLNGGAPGTDILTVPQAKQYIYGNYDGEGHAITDAVISAFFGVNNNRLAEGDSLCIQYAKIVDDVHASHSGRREAIPENSNTAVDANALFNSRVSPDMLVNCLPICKVINGDLVFLNGYKVSTGSVAMALGGTAAHALTHAATGVDPIDYTSLNGLMVQGFRMYSAVVSGVNNIVIETPFRAIIEGKLRVFPYVNTWLTDGAGDVLEGLVPSTWYYLYAYYDTGTAQILFEKSTTSPDSSYTTKSGDVSRIYLGAFYTSATTPYIIAFYRLGRKTVYKIDNNATSDDQGYRETWTHTGDTNLTTFDLSARVPPTTRLVRIFASIAGGAVNSGVAVREGPATNEPIQDFRVIQSVVASLSVAWLDMVTDVNRCIQVQLSSNANVVDVFVCSYED